MKYLKFIFSVVGLITTMQGTAAEFCVTDESELRAALTTAATNNQDDQIKIEMGDYETLGNTFLYSEVQGFDLDISGGWVNFFGSPCGVQGPAVLLDTSLDGSNSGVVMRIILSGESNLTVSRLSFLNGNDLAARGGGLRVTRNGNVSTGHVIIENNAFLSNKSAWASAFNISSANRIDIRNNLIVNNESTFSYAVEVVTGEAYGVYFNNNTVTGNFSTNSNSSGVYIASSEDATRVLVANNILRTNMTEDLRISTPGDSSYVFRNNLGVKDIGNPLAEFGNFDLPPRYIGSISPFYRPGEASPLIDAGTDPCPVLCQFPVPFFSNWSLGEADLVGQLRKQGDAVDIGAFESSLIDDLIFWNRFD